MTTAPVQVGPLSSHDGPNPSPVRYLTPRLTEVLQLAASGYSNKRIGEALGTTEHTVKSQMATILRRLHVEDRTQAVAVGIRLGLVNVQAANMPKHLRLVQQNSVGLQDSPSLEQLFNLVERAERKGGLSYEEGSRLRAGLQSLAADRCASEPVEDPAVAELRRKYDNARKNEWRWKQQARLAGSGGPDEEARDALRRVAELAKRWTHIPSKRQAGVSVLAAIRNRD